MNEEFIQAMYALAQSKGYNDSQEQFVGLLGSNPEFYEAMYTVADTAGGFRDGQDRFSELMGLKKKRPARTYSAGISFGAGFYGIYLASGAGSARTEWRFGFTRRTGR